MEMNSWHHRRERGPQPPMYGLDVSDFAAATDEFVRLQKDFSVSNGWLGPGGLPLVQIKLNGTAWKADGLGRSA